jgi:hypothetical protein
MEYVLATPSLITSLTFPSVIDITNGTVPTTFAVGLLPGAWGAHPQVRISFDYIPFDFMIGNSGVAIDTYTDGTPNYGFSTYHVFYGWPPGEYTISFITIWDAVGHLQTYHAADLAAMGLPNHFTVVNDLAPPAPTESIAVDAHGVIDGNQAVITGKANPGEQISVTYKDSRGDTHSLGKVNTDASGNWKLVSGPLLDGEYQQVIATATDIRGYVSTYSKPLSFVVEHAPYSPTINLIRASDGGVSAAAPLVWGYAEFDSTVTLYDGGQKIATINTGLGGWWGYTPTSIAAGTHQLTATTTTAAGLTSPLSAPLAYTTTSQTHALSFTRWLAHQYHQPAARPGQAGQSPACRVRPVQQRAGWQRVNLADHHRDRTGHQCDCLGRCIFHTGHRRRRHATGISRRPQPVARLCQAD